MATVEDEKRLAAEASAELVEDGMTVGLGTGSTVAYLLPVARAAQARPFAASRPRRAPRRPRPSWGCGSRPFDEIDRFDITIDGADQIAPDGWLVKGGGAAHTREKLVAAAADRFVVIADSSKPVTALHGPVPLELLEFGLTATMHRLGDVTLARCASQPRRRRDRRLPRARSPTRSPSRCCSARRLAWSSTACSRRRWSRQ